MKIKAILFSCVLIASQSAMSANWLDTFASSKVKQEKNFLDLASVKAYNLSYGSDKSNYYVTAWIKSNYNTPQKLNNGKFYREVKTLYYFDCTNKKMATGEMIFYTSYGSVVGSQKSYVTTYSTDNWEQVIPDTVGDGLLKSACWFSNGRYQTPFSG